MDENDRLLPVDAVRGIAMFFIGVSHISFYLINDSGILATNARAIGFLASPNFLLMSGLACGYQLAHSPTTATALRIVDRGLFAVLVGHLLVTASIVYMVPPGTAFEHIVITDSIGALLCMAPLLKRTSARRLLWAGAAVYCLSSLVALAWHPTTSAQILFGALLLSVNDGGMPDIGWISPTLPYMGIFLIGVGIGKLIYDYRREGRAEALSVRLAVAGSVAIAGALAVNIARHFVKPWLTGHLAPKNWADVVLTTINIRHDAPPTLTYALFYGGIGVALVGFLGMLPRSPEDTFLVRGGERGGVASAPRTRLLGARHSSGRPLSTPVRRDRPRRGGRSLLYAGRHSSGCPAGRLLLDAGRQHPAQATHAQPFRHPHNAGRQNPARPPDTPDVPLWSDRR